MQERSHLGCSTRRGARDRPAAVAVLALVLAGSHASQSAGPGVSPSASESVSASTGLALERPSRPGAFVDVVGRRAAFFGYEHRGLEAWVYPLKLLDDLQFGFTIEGYPLEIAASDALVRVRATPEATTFIHAHPAFTVHLVAIAPVDEPALVLLLEVRSVLPMRIRASFRPRLALMWPAGLQTGNVGWNEDGRTYELTEETGRFAGVIGSPAAREGSLMPYQEEPRDVPVQFVLQPDLDDRGHAVVPIVIAGSTNGVADARAVYARVLGDLPALRDRNVAHYRALLDRTVQVETPDARLNTSFQWAKIAIDKGLATNPALGTGLVAGFRTSGDSERPGFAWFFGRDALWTTFATTGYGDVATTRQALEFLRRYQREDGKVPHEISQSASFLPWFTDYPYAWASADATPLFIAAHADYWRATGDRAFVAEAWPAVEKAYRFSAGTDTDGNGLIENTGVGHGWVEGGALYPPHEEIYLQGVWVAALEGLTELAAVVGDATLGREAADLATRARAAIEAAYWLPDRRAYAYATRQRSERRAVAEPGPYRERRQARLDALVDERVFDERTVLTSVPMWWRAFEADRAEHELDSLGSGALATDWGHRILSSASPLYDPLSYHYGSVWPLFTGWASLGAYRYGRPHVGYQALMASALLRDAHALGYVTELLSGDIQAPFGRSSHHQVWSEAMVAAPLVRGLLGLAIEGGGEVVSFAPQLPASWDRVGVRNVSARGRRLDLVLTRSPGRLTLDIEASRRGSGAPDADPTLVLAPAMPLDASVRGVTLDGRRVAAQSVREGDVQRSIVSLVPTRHRSQVVWSLREGSDVYVEAEPPPAGATSRGLRVLRSRGTTGGLDLLLEGHGGREYRLWVRSPRALGTLPVSVRRDETPVRSAQSHRSLLGAAPAPRPHDVPLLVRFDGDPGTYTRRELTLPLR
jgi:glycogen debranching enzyme